MHTGLLQLHHITGNPARQEPDEMWVMPAEGVVLDSAGMQFPATYIGHIQGTVAQWVALCLIFEVCGGGG